MSTNHRNFCLCNINILNFISLTKEEKPQSLGSIVPTKNKFKNHVNTLSRVIFGLAAVDMPGFVQCQKPFRGDHIFGRDYTSEGLA